MDYHQPLLSDKTYHILSRAVGDEKLFICGENYRYFLQQYDKYISPVADTLAFNLLPNHFHLIANIKPLDELRTLSQSKRRSKVIRDDWQPLLVMQHFSNLLNSYTKSINKKYDRKGSLFINGVRRVAIEDDSQLASTIFYVHKNAVHHGYCEGISDWQWSSYKAILSKMPTKLRREEVIRFFGSENEFEKFHSQPVYLKNAVIVE